MSKQPSNPADYYFIKHAKNKHWSDRRAGNRQPTCVVMHTAEAKNLAAGISRKNAKQLAKDNTAEQVAKYGASTKRQVSWHATVDADSVIWCLPDEVKAWHSGALNSASLGVELACKANVWGRANTSQDWVGAILENAASVVGQWCLTHQIPAERINREQAFRGVKGIIGHAEVDPSRRSDPGVKFPWRSFLNLVREHSEVLQPVAEVSQTVTITKNNVPVLTGQEIKQIRNLLKQK